MAEYAADQALPIPIRLVYSNRSEDEIAYRDELEALERQNARFHVLHTLTRTPTADGRARPDGSIEISSGKQLATWRTRSTTSAAPPAWW